MSNKKTPIETPDEYKERVEYAKRIHDLRTSNIDKRNEQLITLAINAMKAPGLAAAGGIAAALAFYSANYDRLKSVEDSLMIFNNVLLFLFLASLLTIITPALAYFSVFFYGWADAPIELSWHHPFVKNHNRHKLIWFIGDFFRIIAYGFFIFSITFIVVGAYYFRQLI